MGEAAEQPAHLPDGQDARMEDGDTHGEAPKAAIAAKLVESRRA